MSGPFPRVAVIGAGRVGSHLAALLARHGRTVVVVERDEECCELRRRALHMALAGEPEVRDRIAWSFRPADAAGADLVVEALPERLDAKAAVLRRIVELAGEDTVFASTTTSFPLTAVASADERVMSRLVALHVFPPDAALRRPPAGPAVELAFTPSTAPEVREAAAALVRSLGLAPLPGADLPGFVGGALLAGYLNDAVKMLAEGYASAGDIDAAMTLGCGLPVGPLARLDDIGLDTAHDTLAALHERTGDAGYAPAPMLTHRAAAGLTGRKAGRGFHDYRNAEVPAADDTAADGGLPALSSVGVVGSGTMGTGIAEVCARAGVPTVLVARSDSRAKEALVAVERSLGRAAARGRLTPDQADAALGRLTAAADLDAVGGCDLVVEAIAEELAAKREVFARLGRAAHQDALLATTTSSLPVSACAAASGRPHAVVGLHFFNPAPVMRLVEVVRTAKTSPASAARARNAAIALGKRPVECPDRAGFIVNALLFPYLNRAIALTERHGIPPEDVDAVMTGVHGFPMGPLHLLDVIGLDVAVQILRSLHAASGDPALAPGPALTGLVGRGCLGRKTGRGFLVHQAR